MFNLINIYYKNFSKLYIIQNKNECKNDNLLIFGRTLYCIQNNLNSIHNLHEKYNKKDLSTNIRLNLNNSIENQ